MGRTTPKWCAWWLLSVALGACSDPDLADCGSSLSTHPGAREGGSASVATYSETLVAWSLPAGDCDFEVFAGECGDGKRTLSRFGIFTSETRYFEGDRLVGVVTSGDVGACPSACPFSHFYGTLENVRCDSPTFASLCSPPRLASEPTQEWLPFADGRAPGGCN
jgi:hypothetical protein